MTLAATEFMPSASYFRLIRIFPLRPIRSEREYTEARKVMEGLAVRGEEDLDTGERDYLDGLDAFISSYDQIYSPCATLLQFQNTTRMQNHLLIYVIFVRI